MTSMTRTALLNNVDHGGLCVAIGQGAAFGDAVNQMLLVPTAFLDAQRDHPILFRHDGETAWEAVTLLGFDRGETLSLGADGWQDCYTPVVQGRGPSVIGVEAGDQDDPKIVSRAMIRASAPPMASRRSCHRAARRRGC